jgi:ribosomal protein L11 methyltransferase|tara:strand:+ start:1594 stop:2493 length:900 start_codon:yes stop_codon:yes gene_type:complete
MKTAFRQVSLTTTFEAEEAVCVLMQHVFEIAPSVFTHPERLNPVVSVYLPERQNVTVANKGDVVDGLKNIEKCGLQVGAGELEIKRLRREDWVDSWKRHFLPIDIAGQLLVKPSWRKEKAARDQAVVILDPGLSFGTGQHVTTKFCLRQLVGIRKRSESQSLLDVGTGSGILAIAAAKLGYQPIRAIDFDSEAVRVAKENAKRNRVVQAVKTSLGDVSELSLKPRVKFDVVCANLFYDLLIANADRLISRVKPSGFLVLAGILDEQFVKVKTVFESCGAKLKRTTRRGEWRSGTFVHAG